MIELLLRLGACINHRDNSGCTALHLAAKRGDAATVALLVRRGIDCGVRNHVGATATQVAIESQCVAVVRAIRQGSSSVGTCASSFHAAAAGKAKDPGGDATSGFVRAGVASSV